jgi:hypothetical protein
MQKIAKLVPAVFAAACFFSAPLHALTIITEMNRYQGKIVSESQTEIRLLQESGDEVTLDRAVILQIYDDQNQLIWSNPAIKSAPKPETIQPANSSTPKPKDADETMFFDIEINYAPGSLISGRQYSNMKEGLVPSPTSLRFSGFDIAAKYFPVQYFGIGFRYAWGTVTAVNGSDKLEVYSISSPEPFVALRFLTKSRRWGLESHLALKIPSVSYADEFKTFVQNQAAAKGLVASFPSAATGIGYAIRATVRWYVLDHAFLTAGIEYQYMSTRFSGDPTRFDGAYLTFPFGAGVYF